MKERSSRAVYERGVEAGRQQERERHAALVVAAQMASDCWENGHDIVSGSHAAHTLTKTLSQLED
jgi:hypothetical protein